MVEPDSVKIVIVKGFVFEIRESKEGRPSSGQGEQRRVREFALSRHVSPHTRGILTFGRTGE